MTYVYTHILLICTHVLHTHMHTHTHKYTYICIFPVSVHCKDLGAAALLISMSTLSSQILVSKYHSLIRETRARLIPGLGRENIRWAGTFYARKWGNDQRTMEICQKQAPACRGPQWPTWGQFQHQNKLWW